MFTGLTLCFVQRLHSNVMRRRVEESGGLVQTTPRAETTYVVCPSALPLDRASALLRLSPDEIRTLVAAGVEFVTPAFVSHCILAGEVEAAAAARHRPAALVQGLRAPRPEAGPISSSSYATKQPDAASPLPAARPLPLLPRPPKRRLQALNGGRQAPCRLALREGAFEVAAGHRPRWTGGDTGFPWGTCAVWEEPWNSAGVEATVSALRRSWFRLGPSKAALEGAEGAESPRRELWPEHGAPTSTPTRASSSRGPRRGASSSPGPGSGAPSSAPPPCGHAACARAPACLVQGLEGLKARYVPRRDQFKIKALERAKQVVASTLFALETARDVASAGLRGKSARKVELLIQGRVPGGEFGPRDSGAVLASGNSLSDPAPPFAATPAGAFMELWGVGLHAARAWEQAGHRTAADLERSLESLSPPPTAQQRVGIRHRAALSARVPRAEVELAERRVRAALFQELRDRGNVSDRALERCFAFAAGSYIRGQLDSSDVDILVSLPPGTERLFAGEVMTWLLRRLLDEELLLDEMSPLAPKRGEEVASWMGLCRMLPDGEARRIDIKIYSHALGPFAVSYFASSEEFCRALRDHARRAAEHARALDPRALGFKLSDRGLFLVGPAGEGAANEGSPRSSVIRQVPCACETDIFEALGLEYVPYARRKFA